MVLCGLVLALFLGPVLSGSAAAQEQIKSLHVKLKIQSVTKENFYLGDLWVAPNKFNDAQAGNKYVGLAQAVGVDSAGKAVGLMANWQPSDSAMVEVTPNPGHQVKLIVLKPGQSEVTVSAGGVSKKLVIKATAQNNVMNVEISQ
jgi:hypothetical protein